MFHVLAFDRKGGTWWRGEHLPEDAAERARAEGTLREQLAANPDRFSTAVRVAGGPEVTVEWKSAAGSVGVANLSVGTHGKSVACLLLRGDDEVAEEAAARALEAEIGVAPGHPLAPGFATVRRARRRPLLAAFRVGEPLDAAEERAAVTVEWALGMAYFGTPGMPGTEGAEAWPGVER
jgi:hypothetical protein